MLSRAAQTSAGNSKGFSHSAEDADAPDARDCLHERGGPQSGSLTLGKVVDLAKGFDELLFFLALNLLERPAEMLEVLHPLAVAHDDAAGVGKDVGHDRDAAGIEDFIGLRPGWRIGGLDHDLGSDGLG